MERVIWSSVSQRRFSVTLLGGFAALALILSLVGIYGVVAYTVGRRRRELGIRLALGATPARVQGLVLKESMVPVGLGLAVGAAGALAVTRVLQSLLFEVRPGDPATFTAVAVTLGVAALAASYVPARASARIDPVETIREE
jgi:putative ABC transport system permease protein